MYEQLKEFINENSEIIFLTGGISKEKIEEIENALEIKLNEGYIKYLYKFGMIIGYGITFLGCGIDGEPPVITQTLRFRKLGLDKEYIVIRNADEWVYCLDLKTENIVSWDVFDKKPIVVSNDFANYMLSELTEAKEDWD